MNIIEEKNELVTEIPNTPFTIIECEEGYFPAIGKYRLRAPFKTKEEAIEDTKRTDWFRVMEIVGVVIEMEKEYTKNQ